MSLDQLLTRSCSLQNSVEARQEMETNKQRDQRGSVQFLLYSTDQTAPPPTAVKRILKPQRNFSMEHKKHIRQITTANHMRLAAEAKNMELPVKQPPMSARYLNVESRVFQDSERSCPSTPQRFQYLRSGRAKPDDSFSKADAVDERPSSTYSYRPSTCASGTGSHFMNSSEASFALGDKKDFVRINGRAAKTPIPTTGNAEFMDRTHGYLEKLSRLPKTRPGEIPSYLLRRQEDWKQAARDAAQAEEDAKLPPGCQLMDEAEREEIVEELKRTKAEKELELFRLPIRNDTLRARAKREALEAELCKLEEHLEMLSKPKVYVPINISLDTWELSESVEERKPDSVRQTASRPMLRSK